MCFEFFYQFLYIHSTTHRLRSIYFHLSKSKQWGNMASRNLSTILSAFELLSALADYICHMNMPRSSMLERSRDVVRHLCLYIQNSIKRPKWEHKRELHSGIVAAFRCLSNWLDIHDELLNDSNLLEIIELGISGSKSRLTSGVDVNKNLKVNEPVRWKSNA